jgi:hypothetical protein
MIGTKFKGRLGNQLFQIVFHQYLRTNNPDKTLFISNPHHSYLAKYFEFDEDINRKLTTFSYRIYTYFIKLLYNFKEHYIENNHVPNKINVINNTIYKGFFQTDWYFKNIVGPFKLTLKKSVQDKFNLQFGQSFDNNKTIVVHIRRTDYLYYGKRDISLPLEYFQKRIDELGDIDNYLVYFVSDEMDSVRSFFKQKKNYIFSSNDEITDFQIIKNADIAIISNSSFAWWAAYLSDKQNVVYAPKNWLGFRIGKEHPKRIMTEKFIWCEVLG